MSWLAKIAGALVGPALDWLFKLVAKFFAEKAAEKKDQEDTKKAQEHAEEHDDTSGLFGGNRPK